PPSTQLPASSKKVAPPSRDEALASSLQSKFSEQIAYQYGEDFIQGVSVDRPSDRLTITIGQEWYDLSDRQQQRLAKILLQNTQDAKFQNLTLLNLDSVRIARNPVVGEGIIIFQTVPPVIEEPVIEEPVIDEPVADEVVTDEATDEPIVEPSAELETTVDDPDSENELVDSVDPTS
ncbi:MAG: hypothetical protein F6K09_14460, partial [Merismopedia sp. SIO2A8]|nr:hypothetical protein [Merismopedia sp. SIO2A8]